MKITSLLRFVVSLILHVVAIALVLYFFWPIAQWYIGHRPILGVDFWNMATLARFFRDYFEILPRGYLDVWHAGGPVFENVIFFWYYLIGLIARIIPLISAIKYTVIASFALLLLSVYLGCYRLSKNHLLSAAIAVLVAYSANMYGSLIWGGSLPYFANQLFFPCALFLQIMYLQSGDKRWFWMSVIITGWAFLGHLVNAGTFVFLGSAVVLLFGSRIKKVAPIERIKEIVILFVGSYFLAYRLMLTRKILPSLINALLSGNFLNPFGFGGKSAASVEIEAGGITVSGNADLVAFERSRFLVVFSDSSHVLYILFGICIVLFIAAFILDRKKKSVVSLVPWIMLASFSVMHVFLNAHGVSFLSQAWYRAYWHFPITLGFLLAALWGYARRSLITVYKHAGAVLFVVGLVIG
ncbi:hypothetical protein C4579_02615, partial [Candidatus Microgenomates bacterium]